MLFRSPLWILTEECLFRIHRGMRLGDAVILRTLESSQIDSFITWNTKHFIAKTDINVISPAEYLESRD